MIFDYELELEGIPETTRDLIFERDGYACWLCGDTSHLNIAHQIHASAFRHPFPLFKENGTISIPDLSHSDNLFPLCPSCHTGYNLAFPNWIMVPDADTLRKYLEHEEEDYNYRQKSLESLPRTLPSIDRTKVLYHPAILSTQFQVHMSKVKPVSRWRKHWLGEPTTVIHRAAWHGLLDSNPIQQIRSGRRTFQRGVPPVFQSLIGDLVRLWARAAPRGTRL